MEALPESQTETSLLEEQRQAGTAPYQQYGSGNNLEGNRRPLHV